MRLAGVLVVVAGCGRIDFDAITTYRDVVLADHPAGYWRLGDTGATAKDETGHLDGTYTDGCMHGAAGALAGDRDAATLFDGTCLVTLADAFDYPGTATFSVEAWVAESQLGTFQHYFSRETRAGANPLDGYALLQGPPGVKLERVNNQVQAAPMSTPLVQGVFSHVVATYDGAATDIYIDGVLAQTAADAMPISEIADTATIGGLPGGANLLIGVLDEVAVYDHALDPARIALHHDIGVTGPR